MTDAEIALTIPRQVVERCIDHARREAPRECCGLLSGIGNIVRCWHPLVNESVGNDEFFCSVGLFAPFKRMRAAGEELLAIYHSHVSSPPIPSDKDRRQNYYPDVIHLIVSLAGTQPAIRAYRMSSEKCVEVILSIEEDSARESSRTLDVSPGIPM